MDSARKNCQPGLMGSVLVISLLLAVVNAQCAKFEFPSAKLDHEKATPIITVPENETTPIPFLFHTDSCRDTQQGFIITVSKQDKNNNIFTDVCKMHVSRNSAMSLTNVCKSESGKGKYSLSQRWDRNDGTLWRWRASYTGEASERSVVLRVTYPPRITQIFKSPSSQIVKPESSVSVVCSYDKGNPNVLPSLKDSHGRVLEVYQGRPGEIKHTNHAVSCNDTGRLSCEAPGASENKTMLLLVQCPPEFQEEAENRKHFVVDPDQATPLMFQIRSYTASLSACRLAPWVDSKSSVEPFSVIGEEEDCLSHVQILGSPPDMTLSLGMRKMTSYQQGTWQLTISNDAGSDDAIFVIEFPTEFPSKRVMTEPEPDSRDTVTPLGTLTSFWSPTDTTRGRTVSSPAGPTHEEQHKKNGAMKMVVCLEMVVMVVSLGSILCI